MDIIEFQKDNVLKNLYIVQVEKFSKTENDSICVLVKICILKEIPDTEIFDSE